MMLLMRPRSDTASESHRMSAWALARLDIMSCVRVQPGLHSLVRTERGEADCEEITATNHTTGHRKHRSC
eukprot:5236059-Prymnesium_polylepis.2